MPRYLISFDDGEMDFLQDELPAVGEAAHAVVQAAQEAGVWIFGGGVERQRASIVDTDGKVTAGPFPENKAVIGGFVIIVVSSRPEALPCRQVRRGLPLCAGGSRDHVRPARLMAAGPALGVLRGIMGTERSDPS